MLRLMSLLLKFGNSFLRNTSTVLTSTEFVKIYIYTDTLVVLRRFNRGLADKSRECEFRRRPIPAVDSPDVKVSPPIGSRSSLRSYARSPERGLFSEPCLERHLLLPSPGGAASCAGARRNQVQTLDQHREGDREIEVTARNMEMKAIGDQRDTDQQQEA